MSLVIPTGFAQIALNLKHVNDPQPWVVTYGVDSSGSLSGPAVATHNREVAEEQFMPLIATDVTLISVDARIGPSTGPTPGPTYTAASSTEGGLDEAVLPQNCALLVDKRSDSGGRRNRGRFYIPGCLQENRVDSTGQIAPDFVGELQGAMDDFLLALATDSGVAEATPMVILHSTDSGGGAVPAPTPVTQLVVQSVIATQRRRLRS